MVQSVPLSCLHAEFQKCKIQLRVAVVLAITVKLYLRSRLPSVSEQLRAVPGLLTRLSPIAPPAQLPDGTEIPLPPILLGKLGSDPQKKTVCIYGHLDVQPAALEDGWDSEPFTLVEREGEGARACPPKG